MIINIIIIFIIIIVANIDIITTHTCINNWSTTQIQANFARCAPYIRMCSR